MPSDPPAAPPGASELRDAAGSEFPDAPLSETEKCAEKLKITVSIRRDFPIRKTEKFGAWKWSDATGARTETPMTWSAGANGLTPSRADPIKGWSIGAPTLRGSGRKFATDKNSGIAAKVTLMMGGRLVDSGRTDDVKLVADGLVELETCTTDTGACEFIVEPDNFAQSSVAGHDLANSGPAILCRRFTVSAELTAGELSAVTDPYDPPAGATHARVGNRRKREPKKTELPLSIKPDWWGFGRGKSRDGTDVDLVVVHCTSGARVGNALNQWFGKPPPKGGGPHYMVDIDGHVIKMETDDLKLSHVNGPTDQWERSVNSVSNNPRSIGIEVINPKKNHKYPSTYAVSRAAQDYTGEQYTALIRLCDELRRAHPAIKHRFVGHSDVACGPGAHNDLYLSKRDFDPGTHFEWERLEAAGLGMVLQFATPAVVYGATFQVFPDLRLKLNDRDPGNARGGKFGGTKLSRYPEGSSQADFAETPIARIQKDLRAIGYSLRNENGVFDKWTAGAVKRFKIHFFSGTRGRDTDGKVDVATAAAIRGVADKYA